MPGNGISGCRDLCCGHGVPEPAHDEDSEPVVDFRHVEHVDGLLEVNIIYYLYMD